MVVVDTLLVCCLFYAGTRYIIELVRHHGTHVIILFKFICCVSLGSVHTSAAVAFAISVFCQLMNHLTGTLEQHARVSQQQLSVSPYPMIACTSDIDQASDVQSVKNETPHEEDKELSDQDGGDGSDTNGFIVPRRRIRGGRIRDGADSNSDSEISDYEAPDFQFSDEELDVEHSDDSEDNWSDGDEIDCDEDDYDKISDSKDDSDFNSKFDAGKAFDSSSSNGHSETSGSDRRPQGSDFKNKDTGEDVPMSNGGFPDGPADSENQRFVIEDEDFKKCRSQVEATLVALSPFIRWIQATPVIKDALAGNAEKAFLQKICSALNLLLSRKWADDLEGVTLDQLKIDWKILTSENLIDKDIFQWELEEDRSMLGIPQMSSFVKDLQLGPVSAADSVSLAF